MDGSPCTFGFFCPCGDELKVSTEMRLLEMKVDGEVNAYAAVLKTTFQFHNTGDALKDSTFAFPMDSETSLFSFEAQLNGKTLVGICTEKEAAKKTYDAAIEAGHSAAYLGESDNASDIIKIKLGNIEAKSKVTLEIKLLAPLSSTENSKMLVVLPTVLNPRYNPYMSTMKQSWEETTHELLDKSTKFALELRFFHVHGVTSVDMEGAVAPRAVVTRTDDRNMTLTMSENEEMRSHDVQAVVEFATGNTGTSLFKEFGSAGSENAYLSNDLVALQFTPEVPGALAAAVYEYVFIIDCSGSMGGDRIEYTKKALLVLLKSLQPGCFFNIVKFGSDFEMMSENSVEYSSISLKRAIDYQAAIDSYMGGTEILRPIKAVLRQPALSSRRVFLLTDGGVSNTEEVIKCVSASANGNQFFAVGIGEGASTHLVKGVAKAGNGRHEFVNDVKAINVKMVSLLTSAMEPYLSDFKCDWCAGARGVHIYKPTNVADKTVTAFALLDAGATLEKEIVMKYRIGKEEMTQVVTVPDASTLSTKDAALHRWVMKSKIQECLHERSANGWDEASEGVEKEKTPDEVALNEKLVALSIAANVVTPLTSFVVVDKGSKVKVAEVDVDRGPQIRSCARPKSMMRTLSMKPETYLTRRSCAMPKSMMRTLSMKPETYLLMSANEIEDDVLEYAESSAPAPKPVTLYDQMFAVNTLQEFDGSWLLTSGLTDITGEQGTRPGGASDVIWATLCAVGWLTKSCGEFKDEWVLLVAKATAFLKGNGCTETV